GGVGGGGGGAGGGGGGGGTGGGGDSPISPTHSNGLLAADVPSRARNRSAREGSASGSCPPKIRHRSSAGRNGARMRSMKQHLSHPPHQWSRRRAGSMWNARLQLRNLAWYWGS